MSNQYQLNNFDVSNFLQHYWQQKPLVIRNAFPNFENPLSPDDLAGLSCEDSVESRIISLSNNQYHSAQGPFDEQHYQKLGENDWTLLVQAVDHFVSEVADLIDYFRFIPNWRIDDVMVSYASKGGNCGPHFDNYDVFLIQGLGSRHWKVGPKYSAENSTNNKHSLRLIDNFTSDIEWELNPGDILYLPPLFGHWGIATSADCMTYSIGFRAPSHAEILSDFCDDKIENLNEELRYSDPQRLAQNNPGEISSETIDTIQQILMQQITDKESLADWFGRFITHPKYTNKDDCDDQAIGLDEIVEQLSTGDKVYRDSSARFSFSNYNDKFLLFINGESLLCVNEAIDLAKLICCYPHYSSDEIKPYLSHDSCQPIVELLFSRRFLYLMEIEDE